MRIWTFVKLLATVAVMAVLALTGMLAYHVTVRPLGGYFEKFVPSPRTVAGEPTDMDFVKMVESAETPDIDPGLKAYQKALELIALGEMPLAREKLNSIINIFPGSTCAPEARHIVSQMNLDEILSSTHLDGKQTYVVQRGDSFLGIASKHQTTLDSILYLNGLTGLKNLHPGDELLLMPLEYRVLLDVPRMTVSLWEGGRFICEYPIQRLGTAGRLGSQTVTIRIKAGQLDGRAIKPKAPAPVHDEDGKPAPPPSPPRVRKALHLAKLPLRIAAYTPEDTDAPGIFLSPEDFEELFLLTRVGNTFEIRNPAK